jgi:hypothetical protein
MVLARIITTLALAALACGAASLPAAAADKAHCGDSGYSYAGVLGAARSFGVTGELRMQRAAVVQSGHAAAWIGVGGHGFGPGGTDAWVQSGLISYPDGTSYVYYEVARPGYRSQLVKLRPAVLDRTYRISVAELAGRPGWWQVLVDGRRVSNPISLPGSHGAWEPTAVAESWDGGEPTCNRFRFSFQKLAAASRSGGGWQALTTGATLAAPGYSVARTSSGFVASS